MNEWKEWEYTAPPMKPIIEQVVGQMHTEYENGAMKAVQEVGFNVDKDRLIQALTDARKFYEEGYRAAMSRSEWISVEERLPEKNKTVLLLCKNGAMFTGYMTFDWEDKARFRIHTALSSTKLLNYGRVARWMPLPEPPKEG